MANSIGPNSCVKLQEDIFYLNSGKHKHAGKRTIIGKILSETSYGFHNIEVLASDGPNAFGKGVIIQRPAGNILSAEDCTNWVSSFSASPTFKAGGHVEGTKDGKKVLMDNSKNGGIAMGSSHANGGIKGVVGSEKRPVEIEGGEIVLTAPVAEDKTLYEFEGKQMTPRQIASKLNVDNGGVSFADGGEIHSCKCSGKIYQYGGKTMADTDIINDINRKYQLEKGVQLESQEHRLTLERLNDGYITIDQAIAEIAETHLNENPNYYSESNEQMENGGHISGSNVNDFVFKGVKIGDKFIDTKHRKNKIVSTVTDFVERKSLVTGQVIGYEIWSEYEFMGQKMKSEVVSTTVLINKVQ